ncbi:MAG TPA: GAF domain-containing protein [Candidatus Dormibacteraeota bacterium]|nr:GAF domain-containing protein [Candidatus Dormibacteraeota bacterium]
MAAITPPMQPVVHNRRRRVRHRIQTPAYATFGAESKGALLDLHEIVDISEDGVALQCHWPLELEKRMDLCLDLADCPQPIVTTGQVVWSNELGRAGLRFSSLPPDSLSRLREWLFVNVMAGVANSEVDLTAPFDAHPHVAPRQNYTDTLAAVTAVQRQVEALGRDLGAALQLTAERAQVLVRASGAAIALADPNPDFMICRASSGPDAPPVGARLQVGSGFSGECVKRGVLLRCDDAEMDERVDRESCRALGIRSILAAPVRVGDKSVGLVEVFSAQPNAFAESDERVLQRLAETVLEAANRAARAENLPSLHDVAAPPFVAPQGSVLFASADEENQKPKTEEKSASGLTLPRSYLFILLVAAVLISLALGFFTAPWVQVTAVPWIKNKIHTRAHGQLPTVLASSQPPKTYSDPAIETASFDQLKQMADKGDPAAENALGLRYATGEGVTLNEQEAVRWFTRAAEKGNVPAQSKLGSIYFSGRGVPADPNQAYFWMMVARLSGDDASATLAPFVRAQLTRSQVASIEQAASRWLQEHTTSAKPTPNQAKNSL